MVTLFFKLNNMKNKLEDLTNEELEILVEKAKKEFLNKIENDK